MTRFPPNCKLFWFFNFVLLPHATIVLENAKVVVISVIHTQKNVTPWVLQSNAGPRGWGRNSKMVDMDKMAGGFIGEGKELFSQGANNDSHSSHIIDSKDYNETKMIYHVREYYCSGSTWSMSCWHNMLWGTIKVPLANVHNIWGTIAPKRTASTCKRWGFSVPETQS